MLQFHESAMGWTLPASDSPLALKAAAYTVLLAKEWDKSCIQCGGSTVSQSVSFTDRHTLTCIHKHTLNSLSASDNIAQWTHLIISRVLGQSWFWHCSFRYQLQPESRSASAMRCVTASSPLCSHNPADPDVPLLLPGRHRRVWMSNCTHHVSWFNCLWSTYASNWRIICAFLLCLQTPSAEQEVGKKDGTHHYL